MMPANKECRRLVSYPSGQSEIETVLAADAAVDLHLHTYASDGFWSPSDLVDRLVEVGIVVAAVCDHDTQDSVLEAIDLGRRRGVHIVPGTEVTVRWGERQWHLLVYGISPDDERPDARAFLDVMAAHDEAFMALATDARRRVEASGRALPSLARQVGSRKMMPVHVLRAMIADRHVPRLKEAAELVVALGGNFTHDSPLADVVRVAHEAGGTCVLAHPGRDDLGPALTEQVLDQILQDTPLDGIEGHYRSYTDADTTRYRQMAEDRGLVIGIGSDSHGPGAPVDPRRWRAIWGADLLARLGFTVARTSGEPVWEPGMDPLAQKPPERVAEHVPEPVEV
jgi:predicted metal-dependent phosphoesterase TrpH